MIQKFRELFDTDPLVVKAPGRINLFGGHAGDSGGTVLTAAVNKNVQLAISRRDDDRILLYSSQFDERIEVAVDATRQQGKSHWPNCILGVVDQFVKKGHQLSGFNAVIDSDIPLTAGLSSSGALCCAAIVSLSEIFDMKLSRLSMALIAQSAQQILAGETSPIADTFAAIFGQKGYAIQLDSTNCRHEYVPFQLHGYSIVLLDSGIPHQPVDNRYRACEAAFTAVAKKAAVKSRKDITLAMLEQYVEDPAIQRQCIFIIRENARMIAACADLRIGDIMSFGKRLFESHEGLRSDYSGSCPELDFLANAVRKYAAVAGARPIAGGMGGCTINLIQEEYIREITDTIGYDYLKATGRKVTTYIVETAGGASVMTPQPNSIMA